jgi:transcriptional regulator with XRE-family HTH domain
MSKKGVAILTDENETKRIFAENLRKLLDIKGVTQKDFADALRMNRQTINSWVRGVSFPTSEKLDMIAAYFGVDSSALISFLETDHRLPAHLLAYMRALNSDGLRKLEERAEELLEIERYKRK